MGSFFLDLQILLWSQNYQHFHGIVTIFYVTSEKLIKF